MNIRQPNLLGIRGLRRRESVTQFSQLTPSETVLLVAVDHDVTVGWSIGSVVKSITTIPFRAPVNRSTWKNSMKMVPIASAGIVEGKNSPLVPAFCAAR